MLIFVGKKLEEIDFKSSDKNIAAIYNSLDYAVEVHINYLKTYLKKAPTVLFLGMNPGLNGMCQTGVSSTLKYKSYKTVFKKNPFLGTFWTCCNNQKLDEVVRSCRKTSK